ncbi:MAG: hypothetical protein QW343_04420 [Candidatus Norongarragalinales archaeon]
MELVFAIDAAQKNKLTRVLEAEPYADDSFARVGYTLRESAALGLPAGKFVVHVKVEDAALGARLEAKLRAVEGISEVAGEDKRKVCEAIAREQDAACSGFGAVFG